MRAGDDTIVVLQDLSELVEISAKNREVKTILHHGAINAAFSKSLIRFLQRKGMFNFDEKDLKGKTPLEYAGEQVVDNLQIDPYAGHWEQESLQSLRDACNYE
ncbi:ankyrin [Penicillium sp. IBT 18751x]|nr:ankyrin [Penicillium sp. IBT 18751x]